MCGIIYLQRKDGINPLKMLRKRYEAQKTRGTNGYGFVALKEGKIVKYARRQLEASIFKELEDTNMDTVLFHHRTPTSTPNFAELNHPFFVSHPSFKSDYYLVHNGVISNSVEVKEKHDKLELPYSTLAVGQLYIPAFKVAYPSNPVFNDSEALAWEIALYLEGRKTEIEARGSMALVCLEVVKGTGEIKVHFARNWGSPLLINNNKDFFILSSENDGTIVEQGKLHTLENGELKEREVTLRESYSTGYPYYDRTGYEKENDICYKEKYSSEYCGCSKCADRKLLLEDDFDVGTAKEEEEFLQQELSKARMTDDYDEELRLLEELTDLRERLFTEGDMKKLDKKEKSIGYHV